ncbi:MAG TPA: tetratricopeptide repeat protein [Verrucomicrobiales bacterium]|nr:tetratricopeptide repeat protein [Verrucomicrobiales bacterium]
MTHYGFICSLRGTTISVVLAVMLSSSFGEETKESPASANKKWLSEEGARRAEMQRLLANVYINQRQGNFPAAFENYLTYVDLNPEDSDAVIQVVQGLLRQAREAQNGKTRAEFISKAQQLVENAVEAPDSSGQLWGLLGQIYAVQRDFGLSLEANREALKRAPDYLPAYPSLGQVMIGTNRAEEFLEYLDDALKAEIKSPEFYVLLSEIYMNFARALPNDPLRKGLTKLLARADINEIDQPIILQKLGRCRLFLRDFAGSIEAYEKSLLKIPSRRKFLIQRILVDLYINMNKPEVAVQLLETYKKDFSKDEWPYFRLGQLFFDQRKFPESEENFREAIRLNPDVLAVYYLLAETQLLQNKPRSVLATIAQVKKLFTLDFQGEFYQGIAYSRLGEYDKAGNHFTEAEILATMKAPERLDFRFYYQLASNYGQKSDFENAELYFQRCIALKPDFREGYLDLVRIYFETNQPEKVLITLDSVREKFGPTYFTEFYTGVTHHMSKDYDRAIASFLKAEEISTKDDKVKLSHQFYYQLGASYERSGKFEKAAQALMKSLEIQEDFSDAMNYLGYMWAENKENLEQAFELIEKALSSQSENPAYLDSMGWVLYQMEQAAKALPFLMKAVENSEAPDPVILDHLGSIHRALDHKQEAVKAWEQSLDLEENLEIKEKLKTLENH